MLQFKPDLESSLLDILRNGQTQKALENRYRDIRERQWARRQSFLKQNPQLGLSKEDSDIILAKTKESYINEGLARITRHYRRKAAISLLTIDSAEARKALKEVSESEEDFKNFIKGEEARRKKLEGTFDGPVSATHATGPVQREGLRVQ
jgi:hypothetical protein